MSLFLRRYSLAVLVVLFVALVFAAGPAGARSRPGGGEALSVASVESLGMVTFETGYQFDGMEVGGLSGIAYDAWRDVYYVVSDDDEAHYFTVDIDLGSDGQLDDGDVVFLDVTFLRGQRGSLLPAGTVDAESIAMANPGAILISTEGEIDSGIDPFVGRFNPTGKLNRLLPVPDKFLVGGSNQARDNLVFESLTTTPDGHTLYTASENALLNDGPVATLTDPSPARVLQFNLNNTRPLAEYVYVVSPIPFDAIPPGGFADNGLVELQALDNQGNFLAMERSFAVGVGNTVRLFETSTADATDVSGFEVLPGSGLYTPMDKALVADFEVDLGLDPDNLEAMRFGPTLADGRRLLIVVSDNNFNPSQTTQFIALAVELEPASE